MNTWQEWVRCVSTAVADADDATLAAVAGEVLRAGFVLTAGNGGSAALASHFAQAVMKPDYKAGGAARGAICLTDNIATLTAHANDGGWADALVEVAKPVLSLRALVVIFSSSGRSENVVRLASYARNTGHAVVAFTGFTGGPLRDLATISVHVDSQDYEVVEPVHDALMHRVQYHLRRLA